MHKNESCWIKIQVAVDDAYNNISHHGAYNMPPCAVAHGVCMTHKGNPMLSSLIYPNLCHLLLLPLLLSFS